MSFYRNEFSASARKTCVPTFASISTDESLMVVQHFASRVTAASELWPSTLT